MPALLLELNISPERMLDYYRGRAAVVHATAANGKTVQFPANALRSYVSREGIRGWFRLEFDERFRFVSLTRAESNNGIDATA